MAFYSSSSQKEVSKLGRCSRLVLAASRSKNVATPCSGGGGLTGADTGERGRSDGGGRNRSNNLTPLPDGPGQVIEPKGVSHKDVGVLKHRIGHQHEPCGYYTSPIYYLTIRSISGRRVTTPTGRTQPSLTSIGTPSRSESFCCFENCHTSYASVLRFDALPETFIRRFPSLYKRSVDATGNEPEFGRTTGPGDCRQKSC